MVVSLHFLERLLLRGVGSRAGVIHAAPELRELLSSTQVNLNDSRSYPPPADGVFCRNVLIYLDADSRRSMQFESLRVRMFREEV